MPAFAHQLVEGPSGLALDHEHAVVKRRPRGAADLTACRLARVGARAGPSGPQSDRCRRKRRGGRPSRRSSRDGRRRPDGRHPGRGRAGASRHAELQLRQRLAVEAEEHRQSQTRMRIRRARPRRAAILGGTCAAAARHPGIEADLAADVPADDVDRSCGPAARHAAARRNRPRHRSAARPAPARVTRQQVEPSSSSRGGCSRAERAFGPPNSMCELSSRPCGATETAQPVTGVVPGSRPPRRSGSIRRARPVRSSVSR